MTWRAAFTVIAAMALLALTGFAVWLARLPQPVAGVPSPVPAEEARAMLDGLRRPGGARPVVAIIGINDATETTDYLMPAGILRRSGVADVMLLATGPGPVQLYPALRVMPDATMAEFDRAHGQGADYVIVPAMSRDDDPRVLDWLRQQSAKGAMIVAVCAGAKVVASAGLLDGKGATTHWFYLPGMLKDHPGIRYVPDRRIVVDGAVATTTGITASMPMMLTLVEAIAGRDKAEATARDLGLAQWDARHRSAAFGLTRPFVTTVLANRAQVWGRQELALPLQPGMDEVALALVADAWSRTYRSSVASVAATPVTTANGVNVLPDRAGAAADAPPVPLFGDAPPAVALDMTLAAIGQRYGPRTAAVVAAQLEYPAQGPNGSQSQGPNGSQ